MQHLDLQVIEQALTWYREGETVWLCTVLSSFGSSPREPGSLLVARADGSHEGSLSGGCIEEDFLARLKDGAFTRAMQVVRYGDAQTDSPKVRLPCGGILDVLVEKIDPDADQGPQLEQMQAALSGRGPVIRELDLDSGQSQVRPAEPTGPKVERDGQKVQLRLGPTQKLLLAGVSPVAKACADMALSLGFEVVVCDPREEQLAGLDLPGLKLQALLPSVYIASGECHSATAVVALTHDPRLDDLTMMEAVRSPAFYIGVMGSRRTSAQRAERLKRSGGLSEEELARIHMPIGLDLGSKTPAEIALAVMADIVRVYRGRARHEL